MPENGLSECDVCTKFITPAIEKAGWDVQTQVSDEVSHTAGKVVASGKLVARCKKKRAAYVLYLKPGLPLAVVGNGLHHGEDRASKLVEAVVQEMVGQDVSHNVGR